MQVDTTPPFSLIIAKCGAKGPIKLDTSTLGSKNLSILCVKVIVQIIRQKKGRSKRRKKYTDEEFGINDRLFLVALLMYTVAY